MPRRRDFASALGALAAATAGGRLFAAPASQASVREHGARGDGKSDDTAAFQRAVDAAQTVRVPRGTYVVGDLRLRSGTRMAGEGTSSTLLQSAAAPYLLSINPRDGGTADVADNVKDVTISNLTLRGRVAEQGFHEHFHIVNLNACSQVTIERCTIRGFRGDGIYIGSGNSGKVARHNTGISVRECAFDGDNHDNRNAISVIDCFGLVVEGCTFVNCTRREMPGAIDVEPNHNDYHVLRDIVVRGNRFRNASGGVGTICVFLSRKDYRQPPTDFVIEDNVIECAGDDDGIMLASMGDATDATPRMGWIVRRNRVTGARSGFALNGLAGVTFEGNEVSDTKGDAFVSHHTRGRSTDITVQDNTFRELGRSTGRGLRVLPGGPVRILGNRFVDCGFGSRPGGVALDLSLARRGSVEVRENRFEMSASRAFTGVRLARGEDGAALQRANHFAAGVRPVEAR